MVSLEERFNKAFELASAMTKKLPPDIMLRFYAFYTIGANKGSVHMPSGNDGVRNGFKLNALFQYKHLTSDEAKEKYIKLVEGYINYKIN